MSCRSTSFTSAMTSYAKFLNPLLSDSQIQSLFHDLKRAAPNLVSTKEEYQQFIENQITAVRNSELSEHNKSSLIARLETASITFDGISPDNVYAAKNILGQAGAADIVLQTISSKVAEGLGANPDFIRHKINVWRDQPEESYEDVKDIPEEFRYDKVSGVPRDYNSQRALRKLGYEHFLTQPYPVFVYGTLRRGQGNFPIFGEHYYDSASGEVEGISIYGAERPFPYARESKNGLGKTFGDIIWVDETPYGQQVRYSLDSLEGFDSNFPSDSHYERKLQIAKITDPSGKTTTQKVWMYLASGRYKEQLRESEIIESGDWVTARKKYLDSPMGRRESRLWRNSQ
jgi:gamma-glutamylcyclotransferase (GGCT)/AIG2-like uncharacterized protein YtfP